MKRSIKFKLLTIMVLLVFVPLSIMGWMALSKFNTEINVSVNEKLDDITNLTIDNINSELDTIELVSKLLSSDVQIMEYLEGDVTSSNQINAELKLKKESSDNRIEMIVITDSNGKTKLSSNSGSIGISISDREYFKTALTGKIGRSDVIVSKATNNQIIAVANPIIKNSKVIGTVVVTMDFSTIARAIEKIKVFDNGYAYLVRKDGLTLVHPNSDFEMNLNINELGIPEFSDMLIDLQNNKAGERYYTYNEVYKYVNYAPVEHWGLVVAADYNDFMHVNNEVKKTIITIFALSSIIAIARFILQ